MVRGCDEDEDDDVVVWSVSKKNLVGGVLADAGILRRKRWISQLVFWVGTGRPFLLILSNTPSFFLLFGVPVPILSLVRAKSPHLLSSHLDRCSSRKKRAG